MKTQEFEWITDFYPTHGDIEKEQAERGYHPAGYGDPFGIRINIVERVIDGQSKPVEPANWKTTWSCYGSCD